MCYAQHVRTGKSGIVPCGHKVPQHVWLRTMMKHRSEQPRGHSKEKCSKQQLEGRSRPSATTRWNAWLQVSFAVTEQVKDVCQDRYTEQHCQSRDWYHAYSINTPASFGLLPDLYHETTKWHTRTTESELRWLSGKVYDQCVTHRQLDPTPAWTVL